MNAAIDAENLAWTDSTQPELNRARGATDRKHFFTGSLIWMLPALQDKSSFVRNVLGDWQITTIVQAGTGYPLTVWGDVPGWNGGWGATPAGNFGRSPRCAHRGPCSSACA